MRFDSVESLIDPLPLSFCKSNKLFIQHFSLNAKMKNYANYEAKEAID